VSASASASAGSQGRWVFIARFPKGDREWIPRFESSPNTEQVAEQDRSRGFAMVMMMGVGRVHDG
jgi:hypothetical protein